MGQKRTLEEKRKENARRLLQNATPDRPLASYSATELLALMTPTRGRGRPLGSGRVKPEESDKYLYVVGFQERTHGTDPKETLEELLGRKSAHRDYRRLLKRYRDHRPDYFAASLELRWDAAAERWSVVPGAPFAHPGRPIFDADELLKQEP
jgi:hypothetical protein